MEQMEQMEKSNLHQESFNQQKLIELVAKVLQKQPEDITPSTKLLEGDYIDSMNIVAILLELENTYGISFSQDLELDFLEDIHQLTAKVESKIQALSH
jgi:acyl carrier protein